MSGEWPLLIFTILGQLAIGTFVILTLIRTLLDTKIGVKPTAEVTKFGMLAVGPVILLALFASFLHLGSPLLAYHALGNLKTSWLSREILFTSLFLILWFVTFYTSKKGQVNQGLSWVTSIVGLITIFCMAGIYAHSNRPAWTSANTYLSFFGAALVMGTIAAGAAVVYGYRTQKLEGEALKVVQKVSMIALLAIAVQLIYLPIYISGLANNGVAAQASAQLLSGAYAFLFILKWILSILAGVMFFYVLYKQGEARTSSLNLVFIAFGIALLAELIGRYVFYATAVSAVFGL